MNFGALQIATLWRLSKGGVLCNGLVVDGAKDLRLVVTEGGRIVQWERFPTAGLLRARAASELRHRRRAGWVLILRDGSQEVSSSGARNQPEKRGLGNLQMFRQGSSPGQRGGPDVI